MAEPASVTVQFSVSISGREIEASAHLPAGRTTVAELLPVLHGISNMVIAAAEQDVVERGKQVSCRAGCGTCCRQLVPIAESEAQSLAGLIDAMPEDRRARVRERFRAAAEALEASGMLDRLRCVGAMTMSERIQLGVDYFRLGVACPFLEAESCSIHPHRPISCREYLVTSPPENCRNPRADMVEEVPLAAKPSRILCRFGDGRGEGEFRFVLLTLLPEWIEAHREDAQTALPAPELLLNFLRKVTGSKAPGSDSLKADGVIEGRKAGQEDAGA